MFRRFYFTVSVGSTAIFMLFYITDLGKQWLGIEVIHNLKFSSTSSSFYMLSNIFSSDAIQPGQ